MDGFKNRYVRLSVAMAVYNGEAYLREQVDSILRQLEENDELVISVDPCGDASKWIALEFAGQDGRVRVLEGPGQGAICNFENALYKAGGEYIFLADQDDVWSPDKISRCLSVLKRQDVLAVVHNALITDENLRETSRTLFKRRFYRGIFPNIIQNRYIGCCMAFKRKLLSYALPFPKSIPMHDQWLGIVARKCGTVAYIQEPLLYYRRHAQTITGREKAPLWQKIRWRFGIVIPYLRRRTAF